MALGRSCGGSSCKMSCTVSTSVAPWRISAWQPRTWGAWMEPGMANTSRPCSAAKRAVMREPDLSAASTTSVPCASPAMMRLRLGKWCASAGVPSGNSLSNRPWRAMRWASAWWRAGYTRSRPVPTTATVAKVWAGASARAPSCAAASMPSAMPETTQQPASRSARPNWCACCSPCAVGVRLPTIATQRKAANGWSCASTSAMPMACSSKGGSSVASRARG